MNDREHQIRVWSMLCHLAALASLLMPLGNVLGPLLVWQIKKNELPEITPHAKESINFQLTILLITIICSLFMVETIGYWALLRNPLAMLVSGVGLAFLVAMIQLVAYVLVIVASVRANNGELFSYPSIRFLR